MTYRLAGLALAAALIAVPAARAQRARKPAPRSSAPRQEIRVPFRAGEKLTYDVSWSSYLTAGTATVQVIAKKPSYGSTAYYIVAEGRPTPLLSKLYTLYYKVDTLLDAFTLLPQRASVYSEEGKRHRMKTTMFEQPQRKADFSVEVHSVVHRTIAISPVAQDPLGGLFVLRSIPLKPGEKITMPICDNGNSYRVLIQAAGNENVTTPLGSIAAQRFTLTPPPQAGARAIELWLSTDPARVPVKMSAQLSVGAFVLTLSSRS